MRRTIIAALATLSAFIAIPALAGAISNPASVFPFSLLPTTDNSFSVGSSSFRWNQGWFGGTVTIGGQAVVSSGLYPGGGSRTLLSSAADGTFNATKNAGGQLTVSTLPSAATAGAGARAFVTDATACTFAASPTGGGSTACPVYSDGTNWKEG